jgi:protein arginine N-methyltransferase 2
MMGWEKPLMSLHASIICQRKLTGDVQYNGNSFSNNGGQHQQPLRILNVGFGMGIIDEEIQSFNPSYHAIIEAHPSVYERMTSRSWHKRADVHFGKWQDVVPKMLEAGIQFDGIFFDTYGEHWLDMEDFHNYVPQLLAKPNGVYSFFNGLAPDNVFFHGVGEYTLNMD